MSNPTRTPVREIDGDVIAKRVDAQRVQLLGALGVLRVAKVAAGNTGIEKPTWDDMELMLLGVADTLDAVYCGLDPDALLKADGAQEVAHG